MEFLGGTDYKALTGFPCAKKPGFLAIFYTLDNTLDLLGSPLCGGSDTATPTMTYASVITQNRPLMIA